MLAVVIKYLILREISPSRDAECSVHVRPSGIWGRLLVTTHLHFREDPYLNISSYWQIADFPHVGYKAV
jgi:hypothetical protein